MTNSSPVHFHKVSYQGKEQLKCSICLESIKKEDIVIGHLFNKNLIHIIHNSCWEKNLKMLGSNKLSYSCVICRCEFLIPSAPGLSQEILSASEKKILQPFMDGKELNVSISWEEGVGTYIPDDIAPFFLKLSPPQKQRLALLSSIITKTSPQDLEWFLNLSDTACEKILALGIHCFELPVLKREWFLAQSEPRRIFIIAHCRPTLDFIRQEQKWLESLTEREMAVISPLVEKIDLALWEARGGILGNILRGVGNYLLDSFFNWLSGSKSNMNAFRRKEHLQLILELCHLCESNYLSPIQRNLSNREKEWFAGLFIIDTTLFQAIVTVISPMLLSSDQQWLKKALISSEKTEYQLIKKLNLPHEEIAWRLQDKSGKAIVGSWKSALKASSLTQEQKIWLSNLDCSQKKDLLSLSSRNLDAQREFLRLPSQLRSLLLKLCSSPAHFCQKEKNWIQQLNSHMINDADYSIKYLGLTYTKTNDLEKIRRRFIFLTHCRNLTPSQKAFLTHHVACPEKFFEEELEWLKEEEKHEWLKKLGMDTGFSALEYLRLPKSEDSKKICRRVELLSMPEAQRFIGFLNAYPLLLELKMSEKKWFEKIADKDQELFSAIVLRGINEQLFTENDLKWLVTKGKSLSHLNVRLHKASNEDAISLLAGFSGGYIGGYTVTRFTNGNPLFMCIALITSIGILYSLGMENRHNERNRHNESMSSAGRSFQVGTSIGLIGNTLDGHIIGRIIAVGGGAVTLVGISFLAMYWFIFSHLPRQFRR